MAFPVVDASFPTTIPEQAHEATGDNKKNNNIKAAKHLMFFLSGTILQQLLPHTLRW